MLKERGTRLLFFLLKIVSYITPKFIKVTIAKRIANILYKKHKKYYKIAKINLDFIYNDSLTNAKKELIIKDMFYNLVQNIGSFIENQNISKERLLKKVTFINEDILLKANKSGKPIVFVTAHYSNWEILPLAISAKYTPLTGIGRALKQPYLDKILRENRERFGIDMIEKSGAMREMIKVVKKRKPIGLLVDQSLEGVVVDFLGKNASHTTSAALLAHKYDTITIPCFITRVGFEKYEATFYDPIKVDKSHSMESYILQHTQKQAKITEEIIKKEPSQWLWIHRRWKREYPEIYS